MSFVYRRQSMTDCQSAVSLADFLAWTQTDPEARINAIRFLSDHALLWCVMSSSSSFLADKATR
jgi:hypothetical protein